jgi:hypothetical protein
MMLARSPLIWGLLRQPSGLGGMIRRLTHGKVSRPIPERIRLGSATALARALRAEGITGKQGMLVDKGAAT